MGTIGVRRRSIIAASMSISSGRTPEKPMASECARKSSIARTTSRGAGGPTPAQCERSRFSCSERVSSGAINWSLSLPNPVVTP